LASTAASSPGSTESCSLVSDKRDVPDGQGADDGSQVVDWKRYCESAGVSMGRAIVTLIDRELVSVFGDQTGDHLPVFGEQAEEELTAKQEQTARREEEASVVEERLRAWDERLLAGGSPSSRLGSSEPSSSPKYLRDPGRRRRSVATSDVRAARVSSTSTATACPIGSEGSCQIMSC
jgi:hypothetical protein